MSSDNSSHKKELGLQNADSQNANLAELIVELYSEEIPWRMQEPMAQNLAKLLQAELISALGLPKGDNEIKDVFGKLHLYWTPRRVAVAFAAVPKKSKAWVEQRKGPRVASPQVAIDGFVRNNNLGSIGECVKVKDAKGDYYALEVEHKSVATSEVLGEVVATVINKMQKDLKVSMRFADQSFKWVRPLRHILVVFDGTAVQGSINLGNDEKLDFTAKTRGHPFGSVEPFAVASIADYESKLRANYVEPLYAERLAIIKKAIGDVRDNQQVVIEENACLTEYPSVLTGHFDEEFLSLSPSLIKAVLNHHQKIIYDVKSMNQRCGFYFVANVSPATDKDRVSRGVERVVRARLADAKFMLERDMGIPIEEHIKNLEHITFHPKLGSIADKNKRVKKLIPIIIDELKKYKDNHDLNYYDLTRFPKKIDEQKMALATETVREFPKLQDIIGLQLKPETRHEAILYYPYIRIIALSDAIDSLASLWLAGERATGSGDPFFLKRYALEIINNVIDNERIEDNYHLPLLVIFAETVKIINSQKICENKDLEKKDIAINLEYFILSRMRQWMGDNSNVRADCTEAILEQQPKITNFNIENYSILNCNLIEILNHIKTLHEEVTKSNNLAEIFRRLHAILSDELIGGSLLDLDSNLKADDEKQCFLEATDLPNPKLFEKSEEKYLYTLAKDIIMEGKAWDDLSFKQKLENLASLKAVIDAFFDKVMVNVDDKAIRYNRIILLYRIYRRFGELANFDKIQHKDLQQQSRIKQAN